MSWNNFSDRHWSFKVGLGALLTIGMSIAAVKRSMKIEGPQGGKRTVFSINGDYFYHIEPTTAVHYLTIYSRSGQREVVLSNGNAKLRNQMIFNLPRVKTCPGATNWCKSSCYDIRVEKMRPSAVASRKRNLEAAKRPNFVEVMNTAISTFLNLGLTNPVFRWHESGDFYNQTYIKKCYQVMRENPDVKFYAFTHSWMVPSLRKVLIKDKPENFNLILSVDPDPDVPWDGVPPGYPLSFVDGTEVPDHVLENLPVGDHADYSCPRYPESSVIEFFNNQIVLRPAYSSRIPEFMRSKAGQRRPYSPTMERIREELQNNEGDIESVDDLIDYWIDENITIGYAKTKETRTYTGLHDIHDMDFEVELKTGLELR